MRRVQKLKIKLIEEQLNKCNILFMIILKIIFTVMNIELLCFAPIMTDINR